MTKKHFIRFADYLTDAEIHNNLYKTNLIGICAHIAGALAAVMLVF